MEPHTNHCNCSSCHDRHISEKEKKLQVQISESSRRDFLRKATGMGLGIGLGGGLITPLASSCMQSKDGAYKSKSMAASQSVKNGKA